MEDNLITDKHTSASLLANGTSDISEENSAQEENEVSLEQLSLGKRIFTWRTIVPLVIVLVVMAYLAERNINLQQTWSAIRHANLGYFLAAFLIYYLSFPIRAMRWRLLLENVGYTKANGIRLPKFWKLVEIIYISFFANAAVPARLGDLYRAYLLRQNIGVSATRSFGTVLAERLLDIIVLLLLFIPAIIISLNEKLPPQLQTGLEFALGIVLIGIVGLFVLRIAREPIARLIPLRFREHYYHFQEGTLGSFKRLPALAGLTGGVWICEALRFFFVAMALSLFSGDLLHVLTAAIFIGLGEALLSAIPSTGGGVGVVEVGLLSMITLFFHGSGTTLSIATAAIVLDRVISYISLLVIGFVVFLLAFGKQAMKGR